MSKKIKIKDLLEENFSGTMIGGLMIDMYWPLFNVGSIVGQ